uniref:Uncharacterized protein n=1 Tax=Rhizophora mucronata TaxID=61149 RepID=A0A2P2NYT9_RHIMU
MFNLFSVHNWLDVTCRLILKRLRTNALFLDCYFTVIYHILPWSSDSCIIETQDQIENFVFCNFGL